MVDVIAGKTGKGITEEVGGPLQIFAQNGDQGQRRTGNRECADRGIITGGTRQLQGSVNDIKLRFYRAGPDCSGEGEGPAERR